MVELLIIFCSGVYDSHTAPQVVVKAKYAGAACGICALQGEIYSDGSSKATAFEGTEEDAGEHRPIETPGVGIAQRGMVAAEEA